MEIIVYFFAHFSKLLLQMDISVESTPFHSRRSSMASNYSGYSGYSQYSMRSSRSGGGRLRRWTSTASLRHQDKEPRKLLALRIACLAVGCAACGMAYSLDSFTAYSGDLKKTFLATQSQGKFTACTKSHDFECVNSKYTKKRKSAIVHQVGTGNNAFNKVWSSCISL